MIIDWRSSRLLASGLVLAVSVVAVGGCGLPPAGAAVERADVAIITHRNLGGGPAAIVGGSIRASDGCLVMDTADGVAIPSWPEGTTVWWVDGKLVVADAFGKVAATEREEAFFGGGTDYTLNAVEEIADRPIPDACVRTATYMLINALTRQAIE